MNKLLLPVILCIWSLPYIAQAADFSGSRDLIGYINQGNLTLMDLKTKTEENIISSGLGQDFCWDSNGNDIFFLEYNNSDSTLTGKKTNLKGQTPVPLFLKKINRIKDYEDNDADYLQSSI